MNSEGESSGIFATFFPNGPQANHIRFKTLHPLKDGGWRTILSFWEGLFSGDMLVFRGVLHIFVSLISIWIPPTQMPNQMVWANKQTINEVVFYAKVSYKKNQTWHPAPHGLQVRSCIICVFIYVFMCFSMLLSLCMFSFFSIYFYLYFCISIYSCLCLSLFCCLFMFIHIYMSIHLCMYLSIYLSIHPSKHPSIYLSVYLAMYQSNCLSAFFFMSLPIKSSTYPFFHSWVYPQYSGGDHQAKRLSITFPTDGTQPLLTTTIVYLYIYIYTYICHV